MDQQDNKKILEGLLNDWFQKSKYLQGAVEELVTASIVYGESFAKYHYDEVKNEITQHIISLEEIFHDQKIRTGRKTDRTAPKRKSRTKSDKSKS